MLGFYSGRLRGSVYSGFLSIPSICAILGTGIYPSHDPWNRAFSKTYCKMRYHLSGKAIAGPYVGILEGVQGDQDFIRILFKPSRVLANPIFSSCFLL